MRYCAFQAMTKKSYTCISSATIKFLERDRRCFTDCIFCPDVRFLNVALLILLLSDLNFSVVNKNVQLVRIHNGWKVLERNLA